MRAPLVFPGFSHVLPSVTSLRACVQKWYKAGPVPALVGLAATAGYKCHPELIRVLKAVVRDLVSCEQSCTDWLGFAWYVGTRRRLLAKSGAAVSLRRGFGPVVSSQERRTD